MSCRLWSDYKRTYETCPVDAGDASFYEVADVDERSSSGLSHWLDMHNITDGADHPIDNPVTDEEAVYVNVRLGPSTVTETWFVFDKEATLHVGVRNPGLQPIDNVRQVRKSTGALAGQLTVTVDVAAQSTILVHIVLNEGTSASWEMYGYNEDIALLYDVGGQTFSIEYDVCVECS